MDKAYVSEFAEFMNHYLMEHPEEIEEQKHGWDFFWSPEIDSSAPKITKDDIVPDDCYGFNWHTEPSDVTMAATSGADRQTDNRKMH